MSTKPQKDQLLGMIFKDKDNTYEIRSIKNYPKVLLYNLTRNYETDEWPIDYWKEEYDHIISFKTTSYELWL